MLILEESLSNIMKIKNIFFVVCIFFNFCIFADESFVVQKKTRKRSTARVREDIGQKYADIQNETGSLLKTLGGLLQEVSADVQLLCEGNSGDFFTDATSAQLQKYLGKLSSLHSDLKEYHNKVDEQRILLKNKKK